MAYEAYEVWLTNDTGKPLALLTTFLDMQYSLIDSDVGQLTLVLPSTFDMSLLRKDNLVQVWRAPLGTPTMELQELYVLLGWRWAQRGGELTIVALGESIECLLGRRVIAAYSGTTGAAKTDYADDMMRELVNENVVGPIDTDRTMDFVNLAPERSAGPILQLRVSYKNLLSTLRNIGKAARAAGTEVFFDLHPHVAESSFTLEFQTSTGQPGRDLTNQGVLFSQELGNLEDATLEYDWRKAVNVVYGLGQGSGTAQNIQSVEDASRSGASQFARAEGSVSASSQQEDDEVIAVGRIALDAGRPLRVFSGRFQDTRAVRYGLDWRCGDRVTARYLGQEFEAIIRSVNVHVTADSEEIDARAEYED